MELHQSSIQSSVLVNGGRRLTGSTHVDGSKNAALPLLAAAALIGESMRLSNVPTSGDVRAMIQLLARIMHESR